MAKRYNGRGPLQPNFKYMSSVQTPRCIHGNASRTSHQPVTFCFTAKSATSSYQRFKYYIEIIL